jgi:putative molybdopterin biosynthesis protein
MEVLSPKEAAEILKVNKRTVYNEIGRGNLKAKKIGNRYKILKSELENYMKNTENQLI